MPNPVLVTCPAEAWTKVITDEKTALIHIKDTRPESYLSTYRLTGGAAPTDESDALPIIGGSAILGTEVGVDVYIKAKRAQGLVRIDNA